MRMLYVFTLFDKARGAKPLISGIYDKNSKNLEFFIFYLPKSGKSIYDIESDMALFNRRLSSANRIVLNNYKQHIISFNIQDDRRGRVFDVDMPNISAGVDLKSCQKTIASVLIKLCKLKLQYWHIINGDAAVVYAYLQRKGAIYNYKREYPIWGKTYSGRSSAMGFSIQGLGCEPLHNVNGDPVYINFDWVAADMRAVSIMSGDRKLNSAFNGSDPYQKLIDHINSGVSDGLTRDEGKLLMFKSVYSLDADNPALDFYDGFRDWITNCRAKLSVNGYLESILGRKFRVLGDRTERSVFNATIQGSVAHAMQICLRKAWEAYPDNILTENHDSLVLTSAKGSVADKIRVVARIMVQPFNGILKTNPQFPVKVSVGTGYKKWKHYRRYDSYEQIT
jgi:hypothetical protein